MKLNKWRQGSPLTLGIILTMAVKVALWPSGMAYAASSSHHTGAQQESLDSDDDFGLLTIASRVTDVFKRRLPWPIPIPLGISGGNEKDFDANNICGAGTLGSLWQDAAGTQYILSNNHVLARLNAGAPGEIIIQPGLKDCNCGKGLFQAVAKLSDYKFLKTLDPENPGDSYNFVDAAIAETLKLNGVNRVNSEGIILGLKRVYNPGKPSCWPLFDVSLELNVMKSGKQTGLTKGVVVGYNKYTALPNENNMLFSDFIIVEGLGYPFAEKGDSGALVLTVPEAGKYGALPVGVIFAVTESKRAYVTPIRHVMDVWPGLAIVGENDEPTFLPVLDQDKLLPLEAADPGRGILTVQDKVNQLTAILRPRTAALMRHKGVVGVGVGLPRGAKIPIIEIDVEKVTPELRKLLPQKLDGEPIHIVETGRMRLR